MQTHLAGFVKSTVEHEEFEKILNACVHCGFCNATCPTYQLTGDELDGPRGRIYLLKQMLEGEQVSQVTQYHLDRCLSCRSCETTCPSGVEYARLLDLGRVLVEQKVARSLADRIRRKLILSLFPYRQRFKVLFSVAAKVRFILPQRIRQKLSPPKNSRQWPASAHSRKVLIISGCVQSVLAPDIDVAAARVLDKVKITAFSLAESNCCGALNYHLSEHERAKILARQTIDQCWPYVEQGIDAITMTASGCGLALKGYGELLQYDADYAGKAKKFSDLVKDIGEILSHEDLSVFKANKTKVAFQSPCTLQHGQQLSGVVESILTSTGYKLVDVQDSHICCGSAGVYSLLQTEMADQLREQKLQSLQANQADTIATANIGCLSHLQEKSTLPIVHWLELLAADNAYTD